MAHTFGMWEIRIVNTETAVFITRCYLITHFTLLILWNYFAHFYTGGRVNIPKQAGKWCKKYFILILAIGFVLGHWFSQMNYYWR